jgi:putative oxidoreductase
MKQFNSSKNYRLTKLVTVICFLAFVIEIIFLVKYPLGSQQAFFLVLFSGLTLILLALRRIAFTTMFLLSTFTLIIAWRLSALAGYTVVVWVYGMAMLFQLFNYILFAYESIKTVRGQSLLNNGDQARVFEWQLLFIRLYLGFNLIPHFCEKLFAGPTIRAVDVNAFMLLGMHHPLSMVLISGVIELAGAFAISCGFFTRLGAICLAAYLIDCGFLGHHFSNGFIWALPGGGWEFPVLWAVLVISFAFFGAGNFSLDRALKNAYQLPGFLKHIMGGRFT